MYYTYFKRNVNDPNDYDENTLKFVYTPIVLSVVDVFELNINGNPNLLLPIDYAPILDESSTI